MGLRPTQADEKPLLRASHEFVISTEAYPDFLLPDTQQRPRMRLSEERDARS
jgi:hypothetical protein